MSSTDLDTSFSPPPKGFLGGIFIISMDNAPIVGETESERATQEARNTNRAQR